MAMEKFLFTIKLSKGVKLIGWSKMVFSGLMCLLIFVGLMASSAIAQALQKIFKSDEASSFSELITLCDRRWRTCNNFDFFQNFTSSPFCSSRSLSLTARCRLF